MFKIIRHDAIQWLKSRFPSTLKEYQAIKRENTHFSQYKSDCFWAVNIGEQYSIPVILPAAYYACALMPVEDIFDGASTRTGEIIRLSPSAQRTAMVFRQRLDFEKRNELDLLGYFKSAGWKCPHIQKSDGKGPNSEESDGAGSGEGTSGSEESGGKEPNVEESSSKEPDVEKPRKEPDAEKSRKEGSDDEESNGAGCLGALWEAHYLRYQRSGYDIFVESMIECRDADKAYPCKECESAIIEKEKAMRHFIWTKLPYCCGRNHWYKIQLQQHAADKGEPIM